MSHHWTANKTNEYKFANKVIHFVKINVLIGEFMMFGKRLKDILSTTDIHSAAAIYHM